MVYTGTVLSSSEFKSLLTCWEMQLGILEDNTPALAVRELDSQVSFFQKNMSVCGK